MLWHKLARLGLHGNILSALKALYCDVKCAVRINNNLSSYFNVSCGLKQGCLVSPQMFNIYINDLVTSIKELGLGVNVNGSKVPLLLYADDLVLLGACAKDIQLMLDRLDQWCVEWGLLVNSSKSKVVHFRAKGRILTKYPFKCGDKTLDVVQRYKYLGLWLTEHLDYNYMAEQIAASAQRALGMLIVKSKCAGGLPFECYTKLYQSLVQSILDYGVSVWGHHEYACINAVQLRAIRSFLGLHSKSSTSAILGEMGWTPQVIQQKIGIARQMCRLSKMEGTRLNRQVYEWAFTKQCNNCAYFHKVMFDSVNSSSMYDLSSPVTKGDVNMFKEKLMGKFVNEWYIDLNRVSAKRGPGKNKLRTYRCFKFRYKTEDYVMDRCISAGNRRAMAKFRCSATPLLIETGRYQKGVYQPERERVCRHCGNGIENEKHVMLHCPSFDDIRLDLFDHAILCNPAFNILNDDEKFVYIMSSTDMSKYCAKACRLILERHRSFLIL